MIIDSSGLILTNNHVVTGGGRIIVRLHDGREFEAVQVLSDPNTDIAVVRISGAKDLVAASLGNSNDSYVGDWVFAQGQPFGLESTVTAGSSAPKDAELDCRQVKTTFKTMPRSIQATVGDPW